MKTGSQIRIGLVMVFAIAFSNASQACVPPAFERVAFEYGVPADIFYSIALAESGRSTNEFGFKVWPWALNINKRSFYPESKQAALVLIEQVISEGSDHFDVGLMQVSWHFHKATFKANANYALDVGANIDDVWQAVGFYNAGASKRATSIKAAKLYSDRVKRIYNKYVKEGCDESHIASS